MFRGSRLEGPANAESSQALANRVKEHRAAGKSINARTLQSKEYKQNINEPGGLTNIVTLKPLREAASDLYHKATGTPTSDEKRASNKLIADQVNAYKEQTELTRAQIAETKAQTDTEKRRVQEKQIRSLRRTSRSQGASLLGQGDSANQDMNTKLGG